MNQPPEKSLIEEAAIFRGMAASFVEKDWFVTQVIAVLAALDHPDFTVIFSGGTALSKGYGLLQRFSEDIDFRVRASAPVNRKSLSGFKRAVVETLRQSGFPLDDDQVHAGDGNRFIAIDLNYQSAFPQADALRPHIQIELTVSDLALPAIRCAVRSFINELAHHPPEVAAIDCIDPVESAADKLSALTWRVTDRVREQVGDDPSLVRHLHDLAILKDRALAHPQFPMLAAVVMTRDGERAKNATAFSSLTVREKFEQMWHRLNADHEYPKEYARFVNRVSYAQAGDTPDFTQALHALRALTEAVSDQVTG